MVRAENDVQQELKGPRHWYLLVEIPAERGRLRAALIQKRPIKAQLHNPLPKHKTKNYDSRF